VGSDCQPSGNQLLVIFPRLPGQGDFAAKAADCARNLNSMGRTLLRCEGRRLGVVEVLDVVGDGCGGSDRCHTRARPKKLSTTALS
jgi:hypothetical protein